jgi:protein-tyrosine-phosphatase
MWRRSQSRISLMRVLFVCAGNICRSAMAEALLRRLTATRPRLHHVEVGSAGTIALDGNRPLPACVAVMREEFDLDMSAHRARRIGPEMEAELVLVMDTDVLHEVRAIGVRGVVQLLGDAAGFPGEIVDDPYGGSEDHYRRCAAQIDRLVRALADKLEAVAPEARPSP